MIINSIKGYLNKKITWRTRKSIIGHSNMFIGLIARCNNQKEERKFKDCNRIIVKLAIEYHQNHRCIVMKSTIIRKSREFLAFISL